MNKIVLLFVFSCFIMADSYAHNVSVKCKNKDRENLRFSVMCMDENENLRFLDFLS